MERVSKMKKDTNMSECHFFDVQKQQEEQTDRNQTYQEILRIFKEAFSFIDINWLFKK